MIRLPVHANIYSNLLRIDEAALPTVRKLVPDLADAWQVSADNRVWTFKLRKGVTWHDGSPFTSRDVKSTLDRIKSPPANIRSIYGGLLAAVATVETPDEYTVVLTASDPIPYLPSILTLPTFSIVPSNLLASDQHGLELKPVGTGPFQFVVWKKGESLEITRFNRYYVQGLPYLDRQEWRVISDSSAQVAALLVGAVDVIACCSIQKAQADSIAKEQRLLVNKGSSLAQLFVHFNTARAPFDQARSRQAVLYAINTGRFATDVFQGDSFLGDFVGPANMEWSLPSQSIPKQDTARAKIILTEAGFPSGFTTELLVQTARAAEGKAVADQLAAAGIVANVVTADTASWSGRVTKGDYTLALGGMSRGNPRVVYDPVLTLDRFVGGNAGNIWGLKDSGIDGLYIRLKADVIPSSRKAQSDRFQELLYDKVVPAIPLPSPYFYMAMSRSVKGWTDLGLVPDNFRFERVWLEQ